LANEKKGSQRETRSKSKAAKKGSCRQDFRRVNDELKKGRAQRMGAFILRKKEGTVSRKKKLKKRGRKRRSKKNPGSFFTSWREGDLT